MKDQWIVLPEFLVTASLESWKSARGGAMLAALILYLNRDKTIEYLLTNACFGIPRCVFLYLTKIKVINIYTNLL